MDGVKLLAEARDAGLVVAADGDRLVIRGPKMADGLARRVLAHKADVLIVLAAEATLATILESRELDRLSLPDKFPELTGIDFDDLPEPGWGAPRI